MFTGIMRSVNTNPAWAQLHAKISQQLHAQFQQGIQDQRANRARVAAESRAFTAMTQAFNDRTMALHRASMDTSATDSYIAGLHGDNSSSSGGRSSQERYIDSIHDVETFNDPSTPTGTSQHGYADQHWTDGNGSYIHSNDANLDPNVGSTIQWQQMTPAE